MNQAIGLSYHPTTVVFVDDNPDFIASLKALLSKDLACLFFTEPESADTFFKTYQPLWLQDYCQIESTQEKVDQVYSAIDIRNIHTLINVPQRFERIAVVVIDYTMPGMDGLTLSQNIKSRHDNLHIILLTGDADNDLAVKAFNQGLINHFIKKSTPHLVQQLREAIKQLEAQFFLQESKNLLKHVKANTLSCLQDKAFFTWFGELLKAQAIEEYYLLNEHGCFLLVKEDGKLSWLAWMEEEVIAEYQAFAEVEGEDEVVIEQLRRRESLPFFYTEADLRTPPSQWRPYLYSTKRLDGEKSYYYAYLTALNQSSENTIPHAFKAYLKKLT